MTTRFRATWVVPGLVTYGIVRLITLIFIVIRAHVDHLSLAAQLGRWDGRWFMLAAEGLPRHLPVASGHVAQNATAFFPLFSLGLRLVHLGLHLPLVLVGTTLTTLSGAVALGCIALLAFEVKGEEVARRTGMLVALAPGAFVFSLIYAEGFFLSFSALTLLFLRRRRWGVATLLACLATATSPLGLCLSAPAARTAWRQWRQGTAPTALGVLLAPPTTFVSYMLYLWAHTGQFQAWFLTERQGWHSYFTVRFPAHVLWTFAANPVAPTLTQHLLVWGTVTGLVLSIVLLRSGLPEELLVYGLASTLLSACSSPIGLRPRFLLCAYPLLIGLSATLPLRWWRPTWVLSGVLLALMTVEEFISSAIFP